MVRQLLKLIFVLSLSVLIPGFSPVFSQDHEPDHTQAIPDEHAESYDLCDPGHDTHDQAQFQAAETAFHHIANHNLFSIGPWNFPLPCILYSVEDGLDIFLSSKFNFDRWGHGNGRTAYRKYILEGGSIYRVTDPQFPDGSVNIGHVAEEGEELFVCYEGNPFELEVKSTMDGGLFGGGVTSFYDFSVTKNVVTMILVSVILIWIFISIARAYRNRDGMAPKGLQSFMEPIFLFIQDEVAKPFLGEKWEKYLSLLMALFFFILGLNLIGQIPFLGNPNVTGNLAVTLALAIFAFVVTNLSGKRNYWSHVLWMPGVPTLIKVLVITPVEILGLFIKPFTLMLRLFANITAGHMVVLSFIGLIFIFGESGTSLAGAGIGAVVSVPLTIFMMAIELLVAFIQAFVFTILTASYIGAAVEDDHH
jgi:F-type H+-transporting ATPase subunit a